MQFYRPRSSGLQSLFCKVNQQTFSSNPQPRTPPRRFLFPTFTLLVFALAALGQGGLAKASGTLTASPSSASFGTVPIGTSNTQTIQLKNPGSATLTISIA